MPTSLACLPGLSRGYNWTTNVRKHCEVEKAHQGPWFLHGAVPSVPANPPPVFLLVLSHGCCWPNCGPAERMQIILHPLHPSHLPSISIPLGTTWCLSQAHKKTTSGTPNVKLGAAGAAHCCCCSEQEGWQKGALGGVNALAPSPASPKGLIYVFPWQWLQNRARLPGHDARNKGVCQPQRQPVTFAISGKGEGTCSHKSELGLVQGLSREARDRGSSLGLLSESNL